MSLNSFETLLKQNFGLDATALGRAAIDRAVRERAAVCALSDWNDYLEHLRGSEEEMQSLADAIIDTEACFFRDRAAFDTLGRLAVQSWLTAPHGEQLRLLSVGCGGGEEPYSMAMELLDAGFPPERVRIDAVDISTQALTRARQAVYGRHALDGADPRMAERHFTPQHDGLRLDPRVRQVVNFFRGNVLADNFLSTTPEYDFVFCRQLLIYLDDSTQQRLLRNLHRALTRQGVMFVGAAEAGLVRKPEFVPVEIPGASAFLKSGRTRLRESTETARCLRGSSQSPPPSRPASGSGTPGAIPTRTPLDLAAKLAERSQWPDVARLCENFIREQGESAEALYLLGEARAALGDTHQARRHYQRALELRPEHTMASLRMAQLPSESGRSASDQRTPVSGPKFQP